MQCLRVLAVVWAVGCVALLAVAGEAVSEEPPRLECSDAATPPFLRSPAARNAMETLITKLFKCLEKTVAGSYKTVLGIGKDVSVCTAKLPNDFFKCLAKQDVPSKVAELVNVGLETVKCMS